MDAHSRELGGVRSPDVIAGASAKLCHRLGMQALTYGATVEGFGLGANGRVGDPWGDLRTFRRAIDEGTYSRVRVLSGQSVSEGLERQYTVGIATQRARRSPDFK